MWSLHNLYVFTNKRSQFRYLQKSKMFKHVCSLQRLVASPSFVLAALTYTSHRGIGCHKCNHCVSSINAIHQGLGFLFFVKRIYSCREWKSDFKFFSSGMKTPSSWTRSNSHGGWRSFWGRGTFFFLSYGDKWSRFLNIYFYSSILFFKIILQFLLSVGTIYAGSNGD